jgi:hypothetical protein
MKKTIEKLEEAKALAIAGMGLSAFCYIGEAIALLKAPPRFETPEKWEQRTGEKLNELTPVWVRHVYHDDWCWHLGTYEEEKENNKYFEESGYKCDMVIATEAGPPPDGWKPEC